MYGTFLLSLSLNLVFSQRNHCGFCCCSPTVLHVIIRGRRRLMTRHKRSMLKSTRFVKSRCKIQTSSADNRYYLFRDVVKGLPRACKIPAYLTRHRFKSSRGSRVPSIVSRTSTFYIRRLLKILVSLASIKRTRLILRLFCEKERERVINSSLPHDREFLRVG